MKCLLIAGVATVSLLCATGPASAQADCRMAAEQAERETGVPPGLLLAIGRVESGRYDSRAGEVVPWPWAVNAAGEGRFLESTSDAITHVLMQQARGVRSIDVGCFQISLLHHPAAFASLEEAFDPLANARYAARFLLQLQVRAGGWQAAVGLYHSATPAFAEPYRTRVLADWEADGTPVPSWFASASAGGGVRINAALFGIHVIVPAWATAGRPDAIRPVDRAATFTRRSNLPRVIVPGGRT